MQIRTAGELRGFLASIMVGVRDGKVECGQAAAISKIAAQINQSLAVEVNTALQLEKMGKDRPVAGSMLIGSLTDDPETKAIEHDPDATEKWVDGAVAHVRGLKTVAELDQFIANRGDALERLMETRPELHAKVTEALTARRTALKPSLAPEPEEPSDPELEHPADDLALSGELARIDEKLRDGLLWCDQCDGRVSPEDAAGCKSRHCSLKVAA